MRNYFFIFFFIVLLSVNGQIIVNDNLSIVTLVQNLKGTGVEMSNITYDCEVSTSKPYGQYKDTTGASGLLEGMILTTGFSRYAVGPNNKSGQGTQNSYNQKYDDDLLTLVDFTQTDGEFYDVCKVEFDISIYSDELSFRYVFGSEEYPEFEDSFHDLFGFFISGPGINGTKNLALIPFTNDAVSVTNVNGTKNSNYYTSNGDGLVPPFSKIMQYDGFTKVLTAKTEVIPCETYHIKLIIADEGDGIYDSGIFLESGSFTSAEERISQRFEHPKYDYAIEGCNKGYFIFSRIAGEKNNLSQPVELIYSIAGTAINGSDYKAITDTIYIPPFQNTVELEIDAILDGLLEGIETITISIINDCPALPSTFSSTMIIKDYFDFQMEPIEVCQGDVAQLNYPSSTQPFQIIWDKNQNLSCDSCDSPFTTIENNTSFSFTLYDSESGCEFRGTTEGIVIEPPIVFFTYFNNVEYTNLDIFFSNQSQFSNKYLWEFGDGDTSNLINPMHTFLNENDEYNELTFEVTLWAINKETGCKNAYSTLVTITDPFLIPNIITPNEDEENDAFYITGIQNDIWKLKIYNRWGKTVFKTNQYNNRWKAENIPDGVYYYDLINPFEDKKYNGWLQITR